MPPQCRISCCPNPSPRRSWCSRCYASSHSHSIQRAGRIVLLPVPFPAATRNQYQENCPSPGSPLFFVVFVRSISVISLRPCGLPQNGPNLRFYGPLSERNRNRYLGGHRDPGHGNLGSAKPRRAIPKTTRILHGPSQFGCNTNPKRKRVLGRGAVMLRRIFQPSTYHHPAQTRLNLSDR
jgi:hypothetical protein